MTSLSMLCATAGLIAMIRGLAFEDRTLGDLGAALTVCAVFLIIRDLAYMD